MNDLICHIFSDEANHCVVFHGFPYSTSTEDCIALISQYGEISNIKPELKRKGLCFITFFDIRSAQRAVDQKIPLLVGNRSIKTIFAPKESLLMAELSFKSKFEVTIDPRIKITVNQIRFLLFRFGEINSCNNKCIHGHMQRIKTYIVSFFDSRAARKAFENTTPIVFEGRQIHISLKDSNQRCNTRVPLTILDNSLIFQNEDMAFDFALGHQLIDKKQSCDVCIGNASMVLYKDKKKNQGLFFKCPKCRIKKTILNGSIFYHRHQSIHTILYVIYLWANEFSCMQASKQAAVSSNVITDLFKCLRLACVEFVSSNEERIGGENMTVEIDETVMARRKYHRGRLLNIVWVLGGICRETRDIFVCVVKNRTSDTLIDAIRDRVLPGTNINTDGWKAYGALERNNYHHSAVNHSVNFVDPETKCHTQGIERMWRELKKCSKRYEGIPRKDIDLHLCEFVWRRSIKKRKIDPFIGAIELLADIRFYI